MCVSVTSRHVTNIDCCCHVVCSCGMASLHANEETAMSERGISLTRKYSDISPSDLDRAVTTIKQEHPHDGKRLVAQHLHSIGIIVPRSQLRASIHHIDPFNTEVLSPIGVFTVLMAQIHFAGY